MVDVKKLKQAKLKENLKKKLDENVRVFVDEKNPCLFRDVSQCIKCGRCKEMCEEATGLGEYYGVNKQGAIDVCIGCGQCTLACGVNALREKASYRKVLEELNNFDKVLVVSTAPAVRVALAEEFGFDVGLYDEGKMVTALRMLGFDYVFDVTFGADLTIMEEANELVSRITKKTGPLPMFTSCCPSWVRFVELFEPSLIPNLSTAKSPISMQGAIIKTYFAKQKRKKPEDIVHVVITPCTAKKYEITREELSISDDFGYMPGIKDVDYVLTTRELAHMIRRQNIPYGNLYDGNFDEICGRGSGGGVIFGSTGGVMQSALREAHYILTGKEPTDHILKLEKVRGMDGVKDDEVNIGGAIVKVAVVNGIRNAHELIKKIKNKTADYDFIEVMTCRGGCAGGGGQPKTKNVNDFVRKKRGDALYLKDEGLEIRSAHKNPEIKKIYEEFLERPLSDVSKMLLHTKYFDRSDEIKFKGDKNGTKRK